MTTIDGDEADAPRESRKTDWLVAVAALPVAGAVGAASYVHLGTTAWFAGAAASVSYLAMLAVNKLVRRSRRVEALRQEVASLQSELDRLGIRPANDTGPVMPPVLPMANETPAAAKPTLAIEPRPDQPSQQQPGFGRRKKSPQAPTAAQPQDSAPRTAALPENYEGFAPWPEMPTEPRHAPVAQAPATAPTPPTARPQQAPQQQPALQIPTASDRTGPKNYERLQHLVKQLANEVGGPKAMTPDPDRRPAAPQAPQPAKTGQAGAVKPAAPRPNPASQSPDVARVIEAIEAERVDVYLDPIQALDERKPRHFEVAIRFRDDAGQPILSDVFEPIVRAAGLGPRIDLVKLPRVARVAERVQQRGRPSDVLTALTGDSLTDHSFIGQINTALGGAPTTGMVLSFAQSDVRRFGRLHWETLATLSDMGLRFAIDHVTDLDIDFEALKARHFDFVKLDATVFLDGLPAAGGYVSARDICRHFSAIGLALVVGKIASERDLAEILGFGVLLGQGTLFGAPRPVRQDILARTEAA